MTNRLISLAKEYGIGYAVDIFPHYGSDVSSALSAGNDIRGALIGLEQTWMRLAAYVGVPDKELSRKFFDQLKAQL